VGRYGEAIFLARNLPASELASRQGQKTQAMPEHRRGFLTQRGGKTRLLCQRPAGSKSEFTNLALLDYNFSNNPQPALSVDWL